MNKFYLGIILLFFPFVLQSQESNFNIESLTPTSGDLETNNYTPDTTANALYIYEEGFSEFDKKRDFNLVHTYGAKLKILNKKGYKYATIEIPLRKSDNKKEKIHNLKASTYNLKDGQRIERKLSPDNIFIEDLEDYDLLKFTFPDILPGSVLVYTYELESPFIFDFTTWHFQEDIPKAYSIFTAQIPGNYEYNIIKKGSLDLTVQEAEIVKNCADFGMRGLPADCVRSIYAIKDIPAFRTEEYLTSSHNYICKIEFELKQITALDGYIHKYTKTWEDADKELKTDRNIGRQLKRDQVTDGLLPPEISNMPNTLEKARKIYSYVQNNFTWNKEFRIYAEMNIKDILETRTGSVLEINSLLHNIYSQQGFKVLPVMAATRSKGMPTKIHPVLSDFNYFFIQLELNDKKYLLDATARTLDFGRLPFRALNGYARLMDFRNGSSWIDIRPGDYSSITFQDSIKINPDGTANGYSNQLLSGYHAYHYRNRLKKTDKDDLFTQLSNFNENTYAVNTRLTNEDDPSKVLEIKYTLENRSQKIGDKIFLNPFNFNFFDENPFKQDQRSYPIDFGYKDYYLYSSVIEIPDGYRISSLPENKVIGLEAKGGSLILSTTQIAENTVQVNCQLKFAFPAYPAAYYPVLKEFFDKIMEVQSHSLIIIEENS